MYRDKEVLLFQLTSVYRDEEVLLFQLKSVYRDKEVLLFQLKSVYRDEEGQELMEPEELIHAALYEGQSFVFCILNYYN